MRKLILFLFVTCLIACKKDKEVLKTVSSINVINAAVDIASVKINFTGNNISWESTADVINYGANRIYYIETVSRNLLVVSTLDTSKVLFNNSYHFEPGFYTMYITGQLPNVDTLFRREINFPFIKTDVNIPPATDNIVNVRFVNLSPNSPPLKINIKNATVNELEDFNYKQVSSWKAYVNNAATATNYIFEIRNSSTNALLLTYTFGATASNRYKNVALIIKGLAGITTGNNAFSIFPVNYF